MFVGYFHINGMFSRFNSFQECKKMKFLAYVLLFVFIAVVFFAVISFVRFAFVHVKAYVIRRKLSKLTEAEKKKDD